MAGDLVAHLGADSSDFKSGMAQAQSAFGGFKNSVSSGFAGLGSQSAGSLAMMSGMAGGIAGIAFGIGNAVVSGVSSAISSMTHLATEGVGAFRESLQAQRTLSSVIEATGGAAGLTTAEIADYSAELQTLTNFEDDATTKAASMLAAFTNIRGDVFKDTLKGAMDLTTVMGGDLEGNVKLLGKALNDPSEGLGKLAKAGIQFSDAQKKQIETMQQAGDLAGAQGVILDNVASKFGGAAEKAATPWGQVVNMWGDISENIGSLFVPAIDTVGEALKGPLQYIGELTSGFKEWGIEAAAHLANTGEYLMLFKAQAELAFVQIGPIVAHVFTEVIPTYIKWFGDNWRDIMFTAVDYTLTIFINLGQNIRTMWTAVLDFFRGKPLNLDFKPLTEGFASTIKAMPDIPKRVVGEYEKSLTDNVEKMKAHLSESVDKSREEISAKFTTDSKVPAGTVVDEADAKHETKDTGKSKAALAGSSDVASIFLRGIGGDKNDIPQKQLSVAERQLAATEGLRADLKNQEQPEVRDVSP